MATAIPVLFLIMDQGCNFLLVVASKKKLCFKENNMMEMEITFPGGARVDASFGPYTVQTDQPPMGGGEGSAPTPFAIFLASIGTCAGIYVLGFLRQRGLPTEGVRLKQRMVVNTVNGMINQVELIIHLPPNIPEKYHEALVRSAELCAVKKHFESPPSFLIHTLVDELAIGN
jgi:ribosomal protein S12 methylthiotransferase accessory factor